MNNLLAHLAAANQIGQKICSEAGGECNEKCIFYHGGVSCVPAILGRLVKRMEARKEIMHSDDIYIDDSGNVWTRPTAEAYYQVCKALERAKQGQETGDWEDGQP